MLVICFFIFSTVLDMVNFEDNYEMFLIFNENIFCDPSLRITMIIMYVSRQKYRKKYHYIIYIMKSISNSTSSSITPQALRTYKTACR